METTAVPAIDRIVSGTGSTPGATAGGETRVKPREFQAAQSQEPEPQPASQKFPDVGLRFLIDPTSKEVTLLLVDRTSHRVVRTIPPGELVKLKEGDLVDLFY